MYSNNRPTGTGSSQRSPSRKGTPSSPDVAIAFSPDPSLPVPDEATNLVRFTLYIIVFTSIA